MKYTTRWNRMKHRLNLALFPERYFPTLRGTKEKEDPTTFSVGNIVLLLLMVCISTIRITRTGLLGVGAFTALLSMLFAAFFFTQNRKQTEILLTFPLSPRFYMAGRFFLSLFPALTALIGTTLGFLLINRKHSYWYSVLDGKPPVSQILALGLAACCLSLLICALTVLIRSKLSKVGFLWIFVPFTGGILVLLALDPQLTVVQHFWLTHITLPASLVLLVASLGLCLGCYHWAAKLISRWEIPKKVPVRTKLMRAAAALVVLALVTGLMWDSLRYKSPVNESLTPELQYQTALECEQSGDLYGAAVSYYACGDYADARQRCWEMWGKIAPRSTVAVTTNQVAALTEDGRILVSAPPDWDPYFTADDIGHPEDLISIHGGDNFLVGLYKDGTVGIWGEIYTEQPTGIDQWTDITGLFVSPLYVAGLRADGTAVVYGHIPGDTKAALLAQKNLVAIGIGSVHFLGLHPDGSVTADDTYPDGRTSFLSSRDIVAVDGGGLHSVALHADGTVTARGTNSCSQCDTWQWRDIIAIDAGRYSTVGLRSNGTVVATGALGSTLMDEAARDLDTWSDIVAVAVSNYALVGLRSDGTLVATGDTAYIQEALEWEGIRVPQ